MPPEQILALLTLPPELRLQIYELVMSDLINTSTSPPNATNPASNSPPTKISLALLHTSCLLRHEARLLLEKRLALALSHLTAQLSQLHEEAMTIIFDHYEGTVSYRQDLEAKALRGYEEAGVKAKHTRLKRLKAAVTVSRTMELGAVLVKRTRLLREEFEVKQGWL
ncbi:hypothetical protein LTR78_006360 [Recurvomyces mirabilis]|uniref:Uncharacterized protein n=1 Tax=Recurvomyces mirabilis TaxID=574656 RepID=A0AAE1C057_9PEZI|nr:hypothetical protein LTR78_006360 [Recurvomyces mirabilis]KAK5152248.1 hypothetical protein LTS14_008624 [Recurvomyces mirabilis]